VTRVDRISALVILVFGVLACLESVRMGVWKGEVPGSGFFPLVGAGGMTLLAVLLLATSRDASPDEKKPFMPQSDELKQLGAFVPALLLYPIFAHLLGFAPSSVVFLTLLFRHPGRYGWITSLVVSLLTVAVLYAGLVVLLRAELPKGPLGI
jgi:hypothetical protein